ncbi:hypothetical protein AQUCO_04200141v1 [Aquilegia coerulea]|uniref:QWRF motif-containing protein 2 n=1 Tax=Aquilegia coerulea TaxID=218851 RepID=A0A2G5CPE3_AQUCA|nr:hypothetical protein AQUCO_04200141v1 [Aquilegia coerulea]
MVVAVASSNNQTPRPPLLPESTDNGRRDFTSRKPKSREVTSRYLSSSSSITSTSSTSTSSNSSSTSNFSNVSRRSATPLASRTPSSSTTIKRAQSVERRRPVTPRPSLQQQQQLLTDSCSRPSNVGGVNVDGSVSVASKILFTSTRSLAVSFQGESFSLPISKTKPVPPPLILRKSTPERKRNGIIPARGGIGGDQVENSKPVDQHRWPARTRSVVNVNPLSRSLDISSEKKRFGVGVGVGSSNVVRALQQSMIDEGSRRSFDGRNVELVKSIQFPIDIDSIDGSIASDLIASDTESVSSGGSSGVHEWGGGLGRMRNVPPTPRGISVPARFWQETNSRMRRLHEPGSTLGMMATPKPNLTKRFSVESPALSPRSISSNRITASPLRGAVRPASPSKLMVSSTPSPSRGMLSPSRTRNATAGSAAAQLSNMPSILSFVGRGKIGENRIVDAHTLRLLYNRQLQWGFVNARGNAAMLVQRLTTEKNLYNAWITISVLRDSVTVKRIKLQFLRQNLKLISILKGQMTYLEECGLLDRELSSSLAGAIEALEASTLRLPIVGGARADIQNMKDAICSAVDVMQAMASSICSSLSKVVEVNNLAADLARVTRQEQALLDQCKDLLSTLAAMQVKESSLRTYILQLKRVPTSLTTQV